MSNEYRVEARMVKGDWPALVTLLALFIAGAVLYPRLPESVPAHWNLQGEVDRYLSRFWGAFALPILAAVCYLGMLFVPYIDPKRENYARFPAAYRAMRIGLVLVLGVLQALILSAGLGGPANLVPRAVQLVIGGLFVVIGNYLPQARYNYFFGIRTPWTLADEGVWRRTHRFAGVLFVLAGLAMAAAAFLRAPANGIIALGAIVGAAAGSTLYSFLAFRRVRG
ncbi:MAG: SdpI family protein [Thermoanaerobacterales bacterium]|nr:SdpI family protein [Thermoanaerobacterales bacterium]